MSDIKGYLKINNTRLYYSIKGEGDPLVLIHGGPFCNHRIWDYQIDSLSSKYKVICFDKRGHGKSDLPIDAFSHLEDFKSLMDALELREITIIGSSAGGALATDFALQYPKMVKNLVLVCPSLTGYPYPPNFISEMVNIYITGQSEGPEVAILKFISNPFYEYFFPSLNRADARAKVIKIVKESTKIFRWNPMWETELKPSPYERLAEIQIPVLFISADKDSEIILKIGEYIREKIKHSKEVTMKDCSHFPNVEKPEEFNQIVLDFLKQ
ncbi:alpha/beta fold hydrolase [Desulfosporosinus shakirovi]|uniref:alpha/beta fold hydrolase n=1 Tax=Desulfosporosinus shakirovi TaxID=2885154 RepID=UPI001E2A5771|nr:alpha/beta hydrolase [Desulfosporosinus sp. SRJS8]MCB8815327.1 alpha/beta hydrolase [Desulfosporosinus sp. SRJS8]